MVVFLVEMLFWNVSPGIVITLTSLFPGRRKSVSTADLVMLKRQAECLRMPSPIMIDTNYGEDLNSPCILSLHNVTQCCLFCDLSLTCMYTEICPDNISPSEGLIALNTLLEAKMGHRVAKLLDTLFDIFVN